MASPENFSVLRMLLRALGLSDTAIEDIIDRILEFLSGKDAKSPELQFPYAVRDDFLSPAEFSFYRVLQTVVLDRAIICPKVALGDLFFSTEKDPSLFRAFTNKIDRKHVDFLLCDRKTLRPLIGIELDDKSHNRVDRQVRDDFVNGVFSAAKLPLIRVPTQTAYSTVELSTLLRSNVGVSDLIKQTDQETSYASGQLIKMPASIPVAAPIPMASSVPAHAAVPSCPKCGSEMILRTAKTGTNAGGKFWGCSNYPRCRSVVENKN